MHLVRSLIDDCKTVTCRRSDFRCRGVQCSPIVCPFRVQPECQTHTNAQNRLRARTMQRASHCSLPQFCLRVRLSLSPSLSTPSRRIYFNIRQTFRVCGRATERPTSAESSRPRSSADRPNEMLRRVCQPLKPVVWKADWHRRRR